MQKFLVKAQKGRGFMTVQGIETVFVRDKPHVVERSARVNVALHEKILTLVSDDVRDDLTQEEFKELVKDMGETEAINSVKKEPETKPKPKPKSKPKAKTTTKED